MKVTENLKGRKYCGKRRKCWLPATLSHDLSKAKFYLSFSLQKRSLHEISTNQFKNRQNKSTAVAAFYKYDKMSQFLHDDNNGDPKAIVIHPVFAKNSRAKNCSHPSLSDIGPHFQDYPLKLHTQKKELLVLL